MAHQQTSLCFNVFTSFLQEITNVNMMDPENKENIPPVLLGGSSNEDGRNYRSGWKKTGITQLHNTSLTSDCCTPIATRQRVRHTGLTPGNKLVAGARCGVNTVLPTNIADVSVITESDGGDLKENSFFITPLKLCDAADVTIINTSNTSSQVDTAATGATSCIPPALALGGLFDGSMNAPQRAYNPNISVESVLLPKNILLESDEEEDVGSGELQGMQAIKKRHVCEAPCGVKSHSLFHSPEPEARRPKLPRRDLPPPQPPLTKANMNVNRNINITAPRHNCPPPAYPRDDRRQTVTRHVGGPASLIAVGGRRVPIDKLHLLLRPATDGSSTTNGTSTTNNITSSNTTSAGCIITNNNSNNINNNSNNNNNNNNNNNASAPLLPSSRPTPTSVKAVTVVAPPAADPAPLVKRPPPHHRCDYVILEFARGVVMRFQVGHTQPPPAVGRRYLAAVTSSRSPYDNVAYEDAGFCVYVQRQHGDDKNSGNVPAGAMQKSTLYDGYIVREVSASAGADARRLQELASARSNALVECRRQFRFLNLPFELVDVCYTFDQSICIVYYTIQPQEGTSSQPNISRLLRMLQFKLRIKVFLKGITTSE